MANRRRKAPRKGKRGMGSMGRATVDVATLSRHADTGTRSRPLSSGAARVRNARRNSSMDTENEKYLSPEQQYLVRVRRGVEQREARWRRSLIAASLTAAAVLAAVVWVYQGV